MPAVSPSTSSRPRPSSARVARISAAYRAGETAGAAASQVARCGARKYGWFGSFQGLTKRTSAPTSSAAASTARTSCRNAGSASAPGVPARAPSWQPAAGAAAQSGVEPKVDERLPAALLLARGERAQLVAHPGVGGAGRDGAHAAAVRRVEVDRRAGGRLHDVPVDQQPVELRPHAAERPAPALPLRRDRARRGRRYEVRVRLGDADRERRAAGRAVEHGRRRGG